MSGNRLKNSHTLHWAGVVKWVVVVGMFAILAITYLFVKNQSFCLAEENRRREKELDNWNERNRQLQHDIARLKSPEELKRRVANMGLVQLSELKMVPMDMGETRLARGPVPEGSSP